LPSIRCLLPGNPEEFLSLEAGVIFELMMLMRKYDV
jgi:hypothetical protein